MEFSFVKFHSDIKRLQLKEEIENVAAKNAICQLKINETEKQINVEKEISRNIDDITPVKFTLSNCNDKNAVVALSTAQAELQKFYSSFDQTDSYDGNFLR